MVGQIAPMLHIEFNPTDMNKLEEFKSLKVDTSNESSVTEKIDFLWTS